jgi:hypothetical protein
MSSIAVCLLPSYSLLTTKDTRNNLEGYKAKQPLGASRHIRLPGPAHFSVRGVHVVRSKVPAN